MFQIQPAFAVPMTFAKLPDAAALNAELQALFLERAGDPRYRNLEPYTHRNAALFESNFRLFEWPQACVQKLREFCWKVLYGTIRELNGYDLDTLQRLHIACEAWFHVTRRGGYFGPHNHPLHSWSGVYCVAHGSDDPASDSGKLTMINPHATCTMYVDKANFHMKPPYSMGNRMLRLEPGDLVLFPSWLLHQVLPFEGDEPRITVAFNARFLLQGAQPDASPIG
jgi:uncharacterized protein (TIGR02466 family)